MEKEGMKIYKIHLSADYQKPDCKYLLSQYMTLFVYSDSHAAAVYTAMQVLDDAMGPVEYEISNCSTYKAEPGRESALALELECLKVKEFEQLFTKGYVEIK